MATKSANLYARIEPDVKEQAEEILAALGIPASNAINMFYKQIMRAVSYCRPPVDAGACRRNHGRCFYPDESR